MSVRIPKYRKHKSGQAFVQVKGERFYLGKYGTPESEEKYRRYVAELAVSPIPSATTPAAPVFSGLEIIELCVAYWRYAQEYYVKDGEPTGHLDSVRQALRVLKRLYARTPAEEFGPLAFRAVQQALIDNGNARGYINHVCGVVKRIFKWGASQELIPVTVYQALATVPGLKKRPHKSRGDAPNQARPRDRHSDHATPLASCRGRHGAVSTPHWLSARGSVHPTAV